MKKLTRVLCCFAICAATMNGSAFADTTRETAPSKANSTAQLASAVKLLDDYRGDGSDLAEARKILDGILKSDPRNAPAYREYTRYYIMSGHINYLNFQPGSLEAAEKSLKKAIEINPKYAEAYVLGGHLYRLMGRPADAKASLTKADELGTSDPWLQNNWADLLIREGKYEEAMQRYNKVLDNKTANDKAVGVAFEGLVNYYTKKGRLSDVDATYKRSLAREPTAWGYGNYAQFLLCDMDDYEAAQVQITQALKIMNYGVGQSILAGVLQRKWAAKILKGEPADAEAREAMRLSGLPPVLAIRAACGPGPATDAVVQASAKLPVIKP